MNVNISAVLVGIIGLGVGYLAGAQNFLADPEETQPMDSAMHAMTAGLDGKTGNDFDKAFLEEMIVHHEGAIEMAQKLLANTTRPELRKLGEDIITAQTNEVSVMHTWLNDWFGKHN